MSDFHAPRRAESILEAFGADSDFREAVIGDLAEEYALRAGWDGSVAARRWYRRESVRVAPYLLRDWWRRLRWRDAGYFANVILWSSLGTMALAISITGMARGLALALGATDAMVVRWLESPPASILVPAVILLWNLGIGLAGGYLAASLGRRAPLPSTIMLGATWATAMFTLNAWLGHQVQGYVVPAWYLAGNVTALVTGMFAGGVMRAGRRNTRAIESSVE